MTSRWTSKYRERLTKKTILAAITKKKAPCVGAFFFVFCY